MENIEESKPEPQIEHDQEMPEKNNDSSSETSSYHSENSSKLKNVKMDGVDLVLGDLSSEDEMALLEDGETQGPDSYSRFKT